MTKVNVPLTEATPAQLRQFATETLGMAITYNEKPETIRAKIQKAYDKPDISVDLAAPVVSAPPVAGPSVDGEMVTIVIAKTGEPGGDQPVAVGVNGRVQYIERGKPQKIRRPYLEVLENAKVTVYDQVDDRTLKPSTVSAYSYQIIPNAA